MLVEETLELPRLTGTLRTYSSVSKKYNDFDLDIDKTLLKKRKEFIANKNKSSSSSTLSDNINWTNLVSKLIPNLNDSKYSKLKSFLDKLRLSISKQFLNEDFNDSTILNEASLFIFESFYEFRNISNYSSTSNFQNIEKISKKLKEKFGQFPRNTFDACKDLMESIFSELINLNKLDTLNEIFLKRSLTDETSLNANSESFFGENIKFSSFYDDDNFNQNADSESSDEESDYENSSSENEEFEFKFLNEPTNQQTNSIQQDGSKYIDWTKDTPNQISTIVYELLSKNTNSNELQNELAELLGFEKIELVEYLLTNRANVVNAYKLYLIDNVVGDNNSSLGAIKQSIRQNKSSSNNLPTIASEITVHTETEKKIKKQIRKEEKKLTKYNKMPVNSTGAGHDIDSFDPVTLRQLREEQLQEARVLQLYHQKKMSCLLPPTKSSQADQYPYVFDSMLKIAQTSAFVAGSKILLPQNIRRTDTNQFEEVFIPPSESLEQVDREKFKGQKEEICLRPLIKVEDLDQIGQIAFRNIKTLNRIQSIVFDEAYNTNQNLLICAPTGAGKTNIAMLTIVNQIKKNFIDGVLRKDEFKIVYIAPMKALAAEMVDNFSKRLAALGIVVRELTGDMQLTKQEILQTQILVTTPEKWDVVTRKSLGDTSLSLLVKLLIIDEVHLLHDDRGSVIETIVARTLRQVESSQKMIRIVGLSATLPNYMDVAKFLNVDPKKGLFFFDGRFRPVPLAQTFIGVKSLNKLIQQQQMDEACYEKVLKMARQGHQVMVFVHARNATIKTALKLREMAKCNGDIEHFLPEQSKEYGDAQKQMQRSKNKQLREIFDDGFSVHHAGMLRSDRNLVEKCFISGHIRVLVCTATLAWGVNLPAHAVVIKGTELYDSKKGSFVDLSMLDVLQIFGRAGRPQYDKSGEAFIITTHDKLSHYLSLLTRQCPIESQFINSLADNLNAEVCLGSVTNVNEGSKWLSYTYLHVRMKFNPLAYGLTYKSLENDPSLELHRQDLIRVAARLLDKARMMRFDEATGSFHPTDLGRTASHYYIKYDTIEVTNEKLKEIMNDKEILGLISECSEFQQLKVRDEELEELDRLLESCELTVLGGIESTHGKVNCLIQAYISRNRVDGFSLISDMAYIGQNVNRIARALFEMSIKRGWALLSGRILNICKSIEKQIWYFNNPMRQFENILSYEIITKLEDKHLKIDKLRDMSSKELGYLIHHQKMGEKLKQCIDSLPLLEIDTSLHPITRTVLRVKITLSPNFNWNDKIHGLSQFFWVWIEDPDHDHIYHNEYFNLQKKMVKQKEPQLIVFTIPIFEPLPSQYIVRVVSDTWLGVEFSHSISFKHLILPDQHPPHTELLDLDPLPKSALNNPEYESLYSFSHFNPIQTQVFFCLYHTDNNVLLGAPTGSGKTITAELAMFRVFNHYKNKKCVYIAPLKALVRERMTDWKVRFEQKLGKKVVELTGDVVPDMKMVAASDVIVTTPEKWDGISRSWQTRNYVKDVALIVIDEIHLLGEDRGPVLEVIVSRTNFISSHTNHKVRVIGLSTALANARDLANWLGIEEMGLYNFKPSVRPVPLEVHIQSFPGKFYCPRMASMNKPCFTQIRIHSPSKPVLIFVSSRRQTRLTALDLISCLAAESNPKQWLHMPESEMSSIVSQIIDQNLKLTLAFGIGLHHAGLSDKDRKIVEELFLNQKIQILIATSTLAWGLNFPAHLVIVKGTEYYDGKTKRYIDFPITDVLQMMGRAGRPQFDDTGIAVIMVHDAKKHFYKKFLYEPFPVESSLLGVLPDHLCAEIVAATITTKQEAMEYLTWTYFFRRLLINPSYYELESVEKHEINTFLSRLIKNCLQTLESSYCVMIGENGELNATTSGRLSSFYYLTHLTLKMFNESLSNEVDIEALIDIVSMANEFDEFPVRHNEDKLNAELSKDVPLKVNQYTLDSPHTKVNLLLQAHFSHTELPIADYITDTKSVLDQCLRIMQATLDFCADKGWLIACINIINLMQMCCQGRWISDSELLTLPHIDTQHLTRFFNNKQRIDCLPRLIQIIEQHNCQNILENLVGDLMDKNKIKDIYEVVKMLPIIDIKISIAEMSDEKSDKDTRILIDTENEEKLYDLYENEEYVIDFDFLHRNLMKRNNDHHPKSRKAYAPRYPKEKDENWVVLIGSNCQSEYNNELIALKRINSLQFKHQSTQMLIKTPLKSELVSEDNSFMLTIYFMSDVYLGLDQQYNIKINLKSKII